MYLLGWKQFTPFIVTVLGIIFTDLLIGISLGLSCSEQDYNFRVLQGISHKGCG